MGVVQRHGCGRRKDAKGERSSWKLDADRRPPSPLLRQHVLPIGTWVPLSARRPRRLLNTVRFPTVRTAAGTCPLHTSKIR